MSKRLPPNQTPASPAMPSPSCSNPIRTTLSSNRRRQYVLSLFAVLAIVAVAATLRFQRAVINEGSSIRIYTRWRVLLPLQSARRDVLPSSQSPDVFLPCDVKATTDEFACYGLIWVGGQYSRRHSYRCCTLPQ